MSIILNGVAVAAPSSISINDELIWSSDTGRTLSGKFTGRIIAEKQTFQVKWTNLTVNEFKSIKKAISSKFFTVNILGETATCYHGTISRERRNDATGYYGSVSIDFIER